MSLQTQCGAPSPGLVPAPVLPTLWELLTTKSGNKRRIFSMDSHKARLSADAGKPVVIHYMASADGGTKLYPELGLSFNVCPMATSCAEDCLDKSGRMGSPNVTDSYRHKAVAYHLYPSQYMEVIHDNLKWLAVSIPARLNGTSDLRIEKIILPSTGLNILESNPGRDFYDYTKWRLKYREGYLASGGHLTYSFNEGKNAIRNAREYLAAGMSVAVVIAGPLGCKAPKKTAIATLARLIEAGTLWGRPVIDGDKYDDRRGDAPGSLVLLTAKGPALHNSKGFVLRFDESLNLVAGSQI